MRSRSESRDRLERAAEMATWIGTLNDLWERGAPVTVITGSGRTLRGRLDAVGLDHLALLTGDASVVYLALSAVRMLRPGPQENAGPAMGDRSRRASQTLTEVLERISEARTPVVVALTDLPDRLRGHVVGLGEDVLSLRLSATSRNVVYVPIVAVEQVAVPVATAGRARTERESTA